VTRRTLVVAAALLLAPAMAARAATPEAAQVMAASHALQDAVDHGDAAAMQRARAMFVALLTDQPENPAIPYWIALCCWRAEPVVMGKDRDAARRLCKDGIAACDRAFALDPKFGEALALKGTLQGMAITFVPDARMTLAAEMNENLSRAATLDPQNPRIAFLAALTTLYKPIDVGGGPARAKPQLEHAVALFAASDRPGRNGIAWGHDDALLWTGVALSRLGDWAGARERFRQALAANPANGWVKTNLLPEAERHVAAPADSAR
jgi:tetratricopeptide (TPR) repeat protein